MRRQQELELSAQTDVVLVTLKLRGISIPEPTEVGAYLNRYPALLDTVTQVCESALNYVGELGRLSLEVYRDPEIEYVYLALFVRLRHYSENTLDLIENVAGPFRAVLARTHGRFLVTTDFEPVR